MVAILLFSVLLQNNPNKTTNFFKRASQYNIYLEIQAKIDNCLGPHATTTCITGCTPNMTMYVTLCSIRVIIVAMETQQFVPLFTADGARVTVNNTKVFSVAKEMQQWVHSALLSRYTTFSTKHCVCVCVSVFFL